MPVLDIAAPPVSLCRGCGNPVASDHDAVYCEPCQRSRRDYRPQHDPLFADTLLALLQSRSGHPVHVYRELGIESCGIQAWRCVRDHIARFRRHGHVIVGKHDGTYTYHLKSARASRRR